MKQITLSFLVSTILLTGCNSPTSNQTNSTQVPNQNVPVQNYIQYPQNNYQQQYVNNYANTQKDIINNQQNVTPSQINQENTSNLIANPETNKSTPATQSSSPITANNKVKVSIGTNYNTQTLLAGVRIKDVNALTKIAEKNNIKIKRIIKGIDTVVFSTNGQNVEDLINSLSKETLFSFVETDKVSANRPEEEKEIDSSFNILNNVETEDQTNDPYLVLQYGLQAINTFEAWEINKGANAVISVIDSGVDVDHQDMKNQVVNGYDAFSKKAGADAADASGLNYIFSAYKHGSHVAGIAGAESNNEKGISGVAPEAKIMPVKIFPDFSDYFTTSTENDGSAVTVVSAIIDGIIWSVDNGADVINMSLAVWEHSFAMEQAVNYALSKNVSVVVAAGNERHAGNKRNYLAAIKGVIGVGATDQDNKLAYFSNSGDYISVVAPGYDIISSTPSLLGIKKYRRMSGTSMAAPHVAGVVAMLKSKFGNLATPSWIKQRLEETSTDLGATGWDDLYGHGIIDAHKALNAPI